MPTGKGLVIHPCDDLGDILYGRAELLRAFLFLPSKVSLSIPRQKSTATRCALVTMSTKTPAKGACKLLNYNSGAEKLGKSPAVGRNFAAGSQSRCFACFIVGGLCPICVLARFFGLCEKKMKKAGFYRATTLLITIR
jgi:hypothetical protein